MHFPQSACSFSSLFLAISINVCCTVLCSGNTRCLHCTGFVFFAIQLGLCASPDCVQLTSLGTWDRGLWTVLLLLAELTLCLTCNISVKNPYITIFLLTNRLLGCLSFKDLVFELGSRRHQYLSRLDLPMLKNIEVSWTGLIFGRLILGSYFKVFSLRIPIPNFQRGYFLVHGVFLFWG